MCLHEVFVVFKLMQTKIIRKGFWQEENQYNQAP